MVSRISSINRNVSLILRLPRSLQHGTRSCWLSSWTFVACARKFPVCRVKNGGFLKWWYPTTMGFPSKNNHFGMFWGYHHLRKYPNRWIPATKYTHLLIDRNQIQWYNDEAFASQKSFENIRVAVFSELTSVFIRTFGWAISSKFHFTYWMHGVFTS